MAEFPGDSVETLSCDRNDGTAAGIGLTRGKGREASTDLIEGFDQASAGVLGREQSAGCLEHLSEVGAAKIGHAQDAKPADRIVVDGIHGHDVSVLQPRQGLRLISIRTRDLDGHQSLTQTDLLGEIDTREGTTTKLEDDTKARQLVSGLREFASGARSTRPMLELGESLRGYRPGLPRNRRPRTRRRERCPGQTLAVGRRLVGTSHRAFARQGHPTRNGERAPRSDSNPSSLSAMFQSATITRVESTAVLGSGGRSAMEASSSFDPIDRGPI